MADASLLVHRADGSIVWGVGAQGFVYYNRPGANVSMEVVTCPSCGKRWCAVRDATLSRLECPGCEEMIPVKLKEAANG